MANRKHHDRVDRPERKENLCSCLLNRSPCIFILHWAPPFYQVGKLRHNSSLKTLPRFTADPENQSSKLSSVASMSHNLGQDLAAFWASISPSVQWGVRRGALWPFEVQ